VTDYFVENDICYLVMDYIEGKDLEIILEEHGGEKDCLKSR
jgi:serine/threonine protein kinase